MQAPGSLFRCNESAGNLVDSIGTRVGNLTGGPSYQQDVVGWSTVGISFPDGVGRPNGFTFTGENLSTTPAAMFMLIDIETWPSTGNVRSIFSLGGSSSADATEVALLDSGKIRAVRGANTADSTYSYSGVVAIFAVVRPGDSQYRVYVKALNGSLETLAPTWAAPPNATHTVYLGNGFSGTSCDGRMMRVEYWTGTAADLGASDIGDHLARRGFGSLSWDYDATSNKPVPSSSTQWIAFLRAMGLADVAVPDALWLLQETSGNPVDSIGGFTLTATAGSPALAYSQVITGWSRTGIGPSGDNSSGKLENTNTGLPDVLTSSILVVGLIVLQATPAATREFLAVGTTIRMAARLNATPTLQGNNGTNAATGASNPTAAVRPFALLIDRTNSVTAVYTDQEKVVPTWATTMTGKRVLLGGAGANAPQCAYIYACAFFGTNAELGATRIKRLIKALGYAASWTP